MKRGTHMPNEKSYRLSVRLTKEEQEFIRQKAKEMKMSISDYVIYCCVGQKEKSSDKFMNKIIALAREYEKDEGERKGKRK